jgi:uracil-DNA glycosylase
MKPLFIGRCPGRDGSLPLEGKAAILFAGLIGITTETFLAGVDRVNLVDEYYSGYLSLPTAHRAARAIRLGIGDRECHIILCGMDVARAFGVYGHAYFHWIKDWQYAGQRFAIVPHPSRLNRWWDEKMNRSRARKFLTNLWSLSEIERIGAAS